MVKMEEADGDGQDGKDVVDGGGNGRGDGRVDDSRWPKKGDRRVADEYEDIENESALERQAEHVSNATLVLNHVGPSQQAGPGDVNHGFET